MGIEDSSIGIFSPTFDPIRLPIGAETKSAINFQEWALPNNFLLSFSSPISLSESKNNALSAPDIRETPKAKMNSHKRNI